MASSSSALSLNSWATEGVLPFANFVDDRVVRVLEDIINRE